jgi:signal transduction histidine kinase
LADTKQDSLLNDIRKASPDTGKVNRLFRFCLLLSRSNIPGDLITLADEALIISNKAGYTRGTGIANYVTAFYYYAKRNYSSALYTITLAKDQFESSGDKNSMGCCLYLKANMLYDTGNYAGAVENCIAALHAWESTGFNELTGSCCNDLALAYARMGNYSKGVEFAYKAFQAAEKNSDKKEMAQSQHLMGAMFYEFRNYENAMKNFMAAAVIYKETGDKFGFARNNNMIGEILLDEGRPAEAYQKFDQSVKIYSEPGAPAWGLPWGYSNIGSVFEKQGDSALERKEKITGINFYELALDNYQLSLKKFEEIKDPAGIAEQTIYIGKVYFKLGQFPGSKAYLLKGLKMASEAGEKKNLASAYLCLSKIDSAEGNNSDAYAHFKQYMLYKDSIFNMESSQNLSLYKTQLEVEKKDHEIALLATENKLKTTVAEKQSLQKRFAYGAIAAVILLGVFGFYRYRRYNRINSEKKILKERLSISQDLHDHVGSTLSSISVFSKVAQVHGEKGNTGQMNELLDRIRNTSGKMMTEMNDIVWAINPQNDTMEKIIQRMEAFARPLLMARNIQFHFSYDESVLPLNLGMEQRKNFYLIFKEAVNNAIKYSGGSLLEAAITYRQQQLELLVKDNGVGFNPEKEMNDIKSLSGNGLKNMKARAKEMNAELKIESLFGKGAALKLNFHVR